MLQGYMCGFVNNETTSSDIAGSDILCLFGNIEDVYNFNRFDTAILLCAFLC